MKEKKIKNFTKKKERKKKYQSYFMTKFETP